MSSQAITTIEEAIAFLRSQGFQVNPVDGIYQIRKEGWGKLPYELDAEMLINQANLIRSTATASRCEHQESELDRAERRLMEACHQIDAQLRATMAEVRNATEVVRELKERLEQ